MDAPDLLLPLYGEDVARRLRDAPLIVSNVVALATNVVTIAIVLRFRRAA